MKDEKVVFVSSEILIDEIPAYAGGLGILSGGMLSAARDINFPMLGVTFVYNKGYVRHELKNEELLFLPDPYDPAEFFRKIDKKFYIDLKNLRIWFTAWEYKLSEEVAVLFLDTNVAENPRWIRKLTERLYIEESEEEKLLKRLLLGLGTLALAEALRINVKKFHVNESHCGFLAIELFKRLGSVETVRKKLVFTTHTPLPHGHEKFPYPLVEKYYEIPREIKLLSPGTLEMTKVLCFLSGFRNAVSWKHWKLLKTREGFRGDYITNGVHTKWVAEPFREVYDRYIPGWFSRPERFAYALTIPREEIENAREKCKTELIELLEQEGIFNRKLSPRCFTISLRRRITGYKRNDILFRNVERLEELGKRYELQVIIGGVCHPYDTEGRKILENIVDKLSVLHHTRLALLLRNGKKYERACVSACDLFVHAPLPPFEACGTSWMRAGLNAVPTLATRDGGVLECIIPGYNGWLIGKNRLDPEEPYSDTEEFYASLEKIMELHSRERESYLRISLNALRSTGSFFNTHRVLREYAAKAYR